MTYVGKVDELVLPRTSCSYYLQLQFISYLMTMSLLGRRPNVLGILFWMKNQNIKEKRVSYGEWVYYVFLQLFRQAVVYLLQTRPQEWSPNFTSYNARQHDGHFKLAMLAHWATGATDKYKLHVSKTNNARLWILKVRGILEVKMQMISTQNLYSSNKDVKTFTSSSLQNSGNNFPTLTGGHFYENKSFLFIKYATIVNSWN
jgi:hypothetical protein